jgi:hypothetical protein
MRVRAPAHAESAARPGEPERGHDLCGEHEHGQPAQRAGDDEEHSVSAGALVFGHERPRVALGDEAVLRVPVAHRGTLLTAPA